MRLHKLVKSRALTFLFFTGYTEAQWIFTIWQSLEAQHNTNDVRYVMVSQCATFQAFVSEFFSILP